MFHCKLPIGFLKSKICKLVYKWKFKLTQGGILMAKSTNERIAFILNNEQHTELKIMCVLTKCTMSRFIRSAIQDKIKRVKENTAIK
jgi:hypothetical protein